MLQVKERQFSFRRDTRVMARSWTSWRVRKYLAPLKSLTNRSREQMARTFNDKRLMRNVVSKMTVKMQIAEVSFASSRLMPSFVNERQESLWPNEMVFNCNQHSTHGPEMNVADFWQE